MKIPKPVGKVLTYTTLVATLLFVGQVWPTSRASADSPAPTASYTAVGEPSDRTPEIYQGTFTETTVQQVLADHAVQVAPEDKVFAFPDPALGIGTQLKVFRASLVTIVDAGESRRVRTWSPTVAELAVEQNFQLADKDLITPALTTPIPVDGTVLSLAITRVSEVEITQNEAIGFTTKTTNSADLEKGQTQTVTKGVAGVKAVTYLVKRVNGKESSRAIESTKVVQTPVTQVMVNGIGPKLTKSGPYQDLINAAAKKYLINGTALHCLMMKESGGGANTGNPGGTYKGLFQYTDGYWVSASKAAGYAGASPYDAEAQIFATGYALTHGQTGRWGGTWPACANQ